MREILLFTGIASLIALCTVALVTAMNYKVEKHRTELRNRGCLDIGLARVGRGGDRVIWYCPDEDRMYIY